jgi:hypothetical protein
MTRKGQRSYPYDGRRSLIEPSNPGKGKFRRRIKNETLTIHNFDPVGGGKHGFGRLRPNADGSPDRTAADGSPDRTAAD